MLLARGVLTNAEGESLRQGSPVAALVDSVPGSIRYPNRAFVAD
jgi:hypothetical protein